MTDATWRTVVLALLGLTLVVGLLIAAGVLLADLAADCGPQWEQCR